MRKIVLVLISFIVFVLLTNTPVFAQSCSYCPARAGFDEPISIDEPLFDLIEEYDPNDIPQKFISGELEGPFCSYISSTLNKRLITTFTSIECNAPRECSLVNGCIGSEDPKPSECKVRPSKCIMPDHSDCRKKDGIEDKNCSTKYCIDTEDNLAFSQKDADDLKDSGRCENRNTPPEKEPGDKATTPNTPLSLPCDTEGASYDESKGCIRIKTALGNVSTDAAGFTRWMLGFVLSIAGGIVIIIIIVAGYRLMTSQGDPEKVKNARDQLTAAIVGLLFIIFSLALLELITRDILGLPGFGS